MRVLETGFLTQMVRFPSVVGLRMRGRMGGEGIFREQNIAQVHLAWRYLGYMIKCSVKAYAPDAELVLCA